jgi:MerR family transcriptional regulator, light-induced transcriptional regulator
MSNPNPLAAQILETSAAGYASAAHALLIEAPGLGPRFAGASTEWKAHLRQRILELAISVRVDRPELFARRISWLQRAVKARGADEREIRAVLDSLRLALEKELPENLKTTIERPIRLALDVLEKDSEPEPRALDESTPSGKIGLQYLTACLEARTNDAKKLILDALESGLRPQEAYIEILLPAQREIGDMWHEGDVGVAEERLVSETTREVMSLIVDRFAERANPNLTLLAASVAGNAHDIGLRAVADLFRLAGWRVIYLGANMPTLEVIQATRSFEPELVVLSATLTTQIGSLAEAIDGIKQNADSPPVMVGGLALQDSEQLWQQLGADAYAPDVASAVEIGSSLLSRQ